MNYQNAIHTCYPSLSAAEKRVADVILEQKDAAIYASLQEITALAGVGDASVLRFCRKVGYAGFQDLKLAIALAQKGEEEIGSERFADTIAQNLHKTIDDTKDMLELERIQRSSAMIRGARRIFIYGVGASGGAASNMAAKLLRYGVTAHVVSDLHYQLMSSAVMSAADLLIAFSLSGATKAIVEAVWLAKRSGAGVIAVTGYPRSPLADIADVVLLTASRKSPVEGGSVSGLVAQLYITDLLCTSYALKYAEEALAMRDRTYAAIANKTVNKRKGPEA